MYRTLLEAMNAALCPHWKALLVMRCVQLRYTLCHEALPWDCICNPEGFFGTDCLASVTTVDATPDQESVVTHSHLDSCGWAGMWCLLISHLSTSDPSLFVKWHKVVCVVELRLFIAVSLYVQLEPHWSVLALNNGGVISAPLEPWCHVCSCLLVSDSSPYLHNHT